MNNHSHRPLYMYKVNVRDVNVSHPFRAALNGNYRNPLSVISDTTIAYMRVLNDQLLFGLHMYIHIHMYI